MKHVLHVGCFDLRYVLAGAWLGLLMATTMNVLLYGPPMVTTR
jgi:hypothetical protein